MKWEVRIEDHEGNVLYAESRDGHVHFDQEENIRAAMIFTVPEGVDRELFMRQIDRLSWVPDPETT